MVDVITFMDTLHSVQEIAKTSPEPLSKEEIQSYFQDMELSAEQQEMIYQYLQMPEEQNSGAQAENKERAELEKREGKKKNDKKNKEASYSPHFQMYLKEIAAVPKLDEVQERILYEQLLHGQEDAVLELSHQWLTRVICFAQKYISAKALLEDLVQEGNMSLLLGLRQLLGRGAEYGLADSGNSILQEEKKKQIEQKLEEDIVEGLKSYRRELEGERDSENTILAKVSLVYEARKALAEENGTIPTLQELCEYTRIPPEEISDILALHERAEQKG